MAAASCSETSGPFQTTALQPKDFTLRSENCDSFSWQGPSGCLLVLTRTCKAGCRNRAKSFQWHFTLRNRSPPLSRGKAVGLSARTGWSQFWPKIILAPYHMEPPPWSSGHSSWLQVQRSGFDSRRYQILWQVLGLQRGPLNLVSTTEELLGRKSSESGLENREYGGSGPLCDHSTPSTRKSWH
jgi:hypothetical protein